MESVQKKIELLEEKEAVLDLLNEILDHKIFEEKIEKTYLDNGSYLCKQKKVLVRIGVIALYDIDVKADTDTEYVEERFEKAVTECCEILVQNYREEVERLRDEKREEERDPVRRCHK